MKILQKYMLTNFLRTLSMCVGICTLLFLIFDFFDRIDNIVAEKASFFLTLSYFLYKIPVMLSETLPISVLAATMLTLGLLSKNSEITAMRASGLTIFYITKPILLACLVISAFSLFLHEMVVPYSMRRVKEIYNIDIRQKDKRGGYSQSDFWWRSGNDFFAINEFDSRTNTLYDTVKLQVNSDFDIVKRTDAQQTSYLLPGLGWSMKGVDDYVFDNVSGNVEKTNLKIEPLPIKEQPQDFYSLEAEPLSMSYFEMQNFIEKQRANGLSINTYLPDLYSKIAFPFICFIVSWVVLPFSLKPARSGSMASSIMAGLLIGFTYYAVLSFSLAMGRAEIWPALLSAWMANLLMGTVAVIFNLGAEAPN